MLIQKTENFGALNQNDSSKIEFEEPKFRLKFSDNQYLKTKDGKFEIVNKEKAQQFSENQLIILNKTFSIDKFIKEEV